jgi:CPA2 family monovalent cation:H+ antiporter-2
VSSSAIISKVLEELNQTHERAGQLALGMTVLEDVVAITMLTLLTSLIQFGGAQAPPVLPTLGALSAFIVFIALLSLLIVPKLLARLNRNALPEIRTLIVGGLLLLLAWLAVKVGYSLALGAFIFGAIIGSTRYKDDVELVFRGMDQIFGAVFFVTVGMLVDFRDAGRLALGAGRDGAGAGVASNRLLAGIHCRGQHGARIHSGRTDRGAAGRIQFHHRAIGR